MGRDPRPEPRQAFSNSPPAHTGVQRYRPYRPPRTNAGSMGKPPWVSPHGAAGNWRGSAVCVPPAEAAPVHHEIEQPLVHRRRGTGPFGLGAAAFNIGREGLGPRGCFRQLLIHDLASSPQRRFSSGRSRSCALPSDDGRRPRRHRARVGLFAAHHIQGCVQPGARRAWVRFPGRLRPAVAAPSGAARAWGCSTRREC
jgi:hypothetical protein